MNGHRWRPPEKRAEPSECVACKLQRRTIERPRRGNWHDPALGQTVVEDEYLMPHGTDWSYFKPKCLGAK